MERLFGDLLRKLHDFDRNLQCAALKEIAVAIQKANKRDLQDLLEFLNTTHDTELQVKLFSILAAYLLSKNEHCEIIITCKPLYDKIQDVLDRGLPRTSTITLDFIALLSFETDDSQTSRSLALFARNMIRVTGCLTNMSSLLTSGMMHQDTWIALCHSIAEVCRGSEANQSYCSHLVPFCVQSCLQGNVEVFSVLQSLLHNHERNIQLFLETNGISIFTRESLQHNTCMQLLNTIVQKSAQAISLLCKTNVIQHLRDLLRLSGPLSQIGQWSTIILYHVDSGTKKKTAVEDTISDNVSKNNSTTHKKNKTTKIFSNVSITPELDETKNLFQNVIKEVLQWKWQNNKNFKIPIAPNIVNKRVMQRNHTIQHNNMASFVNNHHKAKWIEIEKTIPNIFEPQMHENNTLASKELSFSLLFKDNFWKMNLNSNDNTEGTLCGFENCSKVTNTPIINTDKNPRMVTSDFHQKAELRVDDSKSVIDLRDFKPTFMSTPKRQVVERENLSLSRTYFRNNTQKVDKIKKQRINSKKPPLVEKLKQRSMSARLFSAINDSCTTFVKSVKSIFKTKENTNHSTNTVQDEMTNIHTVTDQLENASCSYSFTDYMIKRDAILASNYTKTDINYDDFSIEMRKNSCKTCSDTLMLRSKLNHNEHLKKTLKKLKMGINLYGCDFKKISKVMWPRERYMTPKVLNNLYRKLILKQ